MYIDSLAGAEPTVRPADDHDERAFQQYILVER
jgi:hypothetical protein